MSWKYSAAGRKATPKPRAETPKAPYEWVRRVLLVLVPFVLFAKVGTFDFINLDDNRNIMRFDKEENRHRPVWPQIWTEPFLALYVPITHSVWQTIKPFAAAERGTPGASEEPTLRTYRPGLYHLVNLALHVTVALLVYFVLLELTANAWGACLGAALFALHPAQIEAFAWVSNLRDVLSGVFFFLAVLGYLRYVRHEGIDKKRAFRAYALAVVSFVFALMSKPTSVVLPLFLGVIAFFLMKRPLRKTLPEMLWLLFFGLPLIFQTMYLQRTESLPFQAPLWQRPLVALDALAFYVRNLFVMTERALDYGRGPRFLLDTYWPLLWSALALAGLFAVWRLRARQPKIFAAVALFLVGLAPVLGLKPFLFQTSSTVADRYLYFSFFGVSLLAAMAVREQRRVNFALFAALVPIAVASFFTLDSWRNSRTVWEKTLRVTPRSWLAANNLASYHEQRREYREAARYYTTNADLSPFVEPLYRAAVIHLVALKEPAYAADILKVAAEREPRNGLIVLNAGFASLSAGRWADAKGYARRALEIDPRNEEAKQVLADALQERNTIRIPASLPVQD